MSPYTKILRWYLDEGEELRALTFPVNALTHKVVAPTIDRIRSKPSVDSAWSMLPTPKDTTEWSLGWVKRATGRAVMVSPEMVAVTDHRILTADPQEFIQKGIVTEEFSIDELTPTFVDADDVLPELHIVQGEKNAASGVSRALHAPRRAASRRCSLMIPRSSYHPQSPSLPTLRGTK